MKFRNYVPHDKNLQEGKLAPAVLPKFEDPVDVPPPEPQAQEVLLYCVLRWLIRHYFSLSLRFVICIFFVQKKN